MKEPSMSRDQQREITQTMPIIPETDAQISRSDTLELGISNMSEEAADEKIWDDLFAATPDDKLNAFADQIRAKVRAGQFKPLDFTNK